MATVITGYTVQQRVASGWTETGSAPDVKTANLLAISQWQKNNLNTRVIDNNAKVYMRALAI